MTLKAVPGRLSYLGKRDRRALGLWKSRSWAKVLNYWCRTERNYDGVPSTVYVLLRYWEEAHRV